MNIRIGYLPIHILITYPHASHALVTRTCQPDASQAPAHVDAGTRRQRPRMPGTPPSPPASGHASSDVHTLATLTTRARARSRARQRASPQHCTPIPTLPYECKRARDRFNAERESPLG